MKRILLLAAATLSAIACGDNGTTLGSAEQAGASTSGGGSGTASEAGASSSAGSGAGDVALGGSSSGGSANAGSAGLPDDGEGGAGAAGAAGLGGAAGASNGGLGCTIAGDCKSVVQNYISRLAAARACEPSLIVEPQCPAEVLDACGCPLSVVSSAKAEVQCYLEALDQVRERGCIACPAVPECAVPTGQCGGAVANPSCQ
jgi:hypothetical protein